MVMMMAMVIMFVSMRMNMAMFNTRSKIFQQLLNEKTSQHEQANQLHFTILYIELRQNMDYCNAE